MLKIKIAVILFIISFSVLICQIGGFSFGDNVLAGQVYIPKADLIQGSGPEIYVLENGLKRWIPDPGTFEYFRYKWNNVKHISDNLLNSYAQGEDLDKYDDYPEGTLLRGAGPEVYLIELGKRRWIPNPAVFGGNGLGWRYVYDIDQDKLKRIPQGGNLTLSETNKYPETIILQGPAEGAVLENSEVTFKFSGTNPLGKTSDLEFETFLAGYDNYWHSQYSNDEETYDLLSQSKVYTFYVRAVNQEGYVDFMPARRTFQIGLSPYYQKVEIRQVKPEEDNFKNDYLILRNNEEEIIDITGWTLENKRKEKIVIPQAIEKLTSPFSAVDYSDIKLGYRDEVIISMNLAPQGINFQTNQCTGYLDQEEKFCPSLGKDCPTISKTDYSSLKKACRDFIDDLDTCQMPDYSKNYEVSADSQCTDFLNRKFNYQQCYSDHFREVDFFQGQWRIFLNKETDFLEEEDILILRDRNGLLIDGYFW